VPSTKLAAPRFRPFGSGATPLSTRDCGRRSLPTMHVGAAFSRAGGGGGGDGDGPNCRPRISASTRGFFSGGPAARLRGTIDPNSCQELCASCPCCMVYGSVLGPCLTEKFIDRQSQNALYDLSLASRRAAESAHARRLAARLRWRTGWSAKSRWSAPVCAKRTRVRQADCKRVHVGVSWQCVRTSRSIVSSMSQRPV
jgi:hypothetical protein